ncbi:GNAT family N-acetyltransferase [Fluviicola sp.]|uniref:GNAT family N-acetyltransferase n=1 Tax=Fluviicola sp. TaxID=1917219 RepID=UPI0031E27BEE
MEIQQSDNGKKGKFFVALGERVVAEMTYVWSGENRITINHTLVSPQMQNQQVGKKLVHAAVKFAEQHQLKITPLCSFAASVFDSTPEYRGVL